MVIDYCSLACTMRDASLTRFATRVVVQPEIEPITLEEARWHLRIDADGSPPESADDPWLEGIGIPAARAWAEGYCGISIAEQTLELVAQTWPSYFELPFGPVQEVAEIVYLDADDVQQTLAADQYTLDETVTPPRVYPATGVTWPALSAERNAVRVQYVAGYNMPDDSPQIVPMTAQARIGMLLMLGHLFENREDTTALNLAIVPSGARVFLDQIRQRFGWA